MTYTYPLYNPYTYLTILTIHFILLCLYIAYTYTPLCYKNHLICNRETNIDSIDNDKWCMNIDIADGSVRMNIEPYGGSMHTLAGSAAWSEVVLSIPAGSDNNSFLSGYDKKAVRLSVLTKYRLFSRLYFNRIHFYLT